MHRELYPPHAVILPHLKLLPIPHSSSERCSIGSFLEYYWSKSVRDRLQNIVPHVGLTRALRFILCFIPRRPPDSQVNCTCAGRA